MVRWHHPLNEHDFEQTPGDRGLGKLACWSLGVAKSWIKLPD